jgi:hypothetical protein
MILFATRLPIKESFDYSMWFTQVVVGIDADFLLISEHLIPALVQTI